MSLVNEVSSKYLTGRIKRFGVQSLSDKELLYYLLNVKMQSKRLQKHVMHFSRTFQVYFRLKILFLKIGNFCLEMTSNRF